jgi:hypothetical protein
MSDNALLERVRVGIDTAAEWPTAVFEILKRRDFAEALADWPAVQAFAVGLDELTLRAERLDPPTREQLLAMINPLPAALKPARDFFVRLAPEINRIKELHVYWRSSHMSRLRLKEAGFSVISLTCRTVDIEKVRDYIKKLNEEAGVSPPLMKVGRPRKFAAAAETTGAASEAVQPKASDRTAERDAAVAELFKKR